MKHIDQEKQAFQTQNWQFSFFSWEKSRLKTYLSQVNPLSSIYPLAKATIGKKVYLVGFRGTADINRLLAMGLLPGVSLKIVSSQPSGSVLVSIKDICIGLGAEMAYKILVSEQPLTQKNQITMENTETTLLREMKEGEKGRVVGYEAARRGYQGKLLSMGLTPDTEFEVIQVSPLGEPIKILVRGLYLSLRKHEADALIVETI